MYEAKRMQIKIGKEEYEFVADLKAFMALNEMQISHPDWYETTTDEDGNLLTARLVMTPETMCGLFAAVSTHDEAYWQDKQAQAHPQAFINAWMVADAMLTQAMVEWEESEEDPFREESVESVGAC